MSMMKRINPLELARRSPAGFAEYASDGEWLIARHLAYLNMKLMQLARRDRHKLMVFMPPRHGKSELISRYLPAWVVGYLRQKVMLVSYEAKFAGEWGTKALNLLLEHGETVFGSHVRRKDASREHWETDEGGVMYTSGVGGAQTGKGCHWLIIDDPIKNAEQARSSAERRNIDDWYRSTASTRVEPNGVTILMMTRWHEEDLAGTLLHDEPEDWDVVRFPAIALEHDILGRQPGEALWPERWPAEELLKHQRTLEADYNWWEAMYQQDPSSPEGNKVKLEWFQTYDELPTEFEDIIIAWDGASKTADHNAFSCAAVWGVAQNGYYVIEVKRGRVEFPDLLEWAIKYGERYPEAMNVIEDTSNGTPLIQTLQRQTRLNVYPQSVHQDKSSRLSQVLNIIAGRNVYLPRQAPWLRDFKEEHRKFPATTFKDQVDTTSLALTYLGKRESRFPEHTRSIVAPQRDNSIYYDDLGTGSLIIPGVRDV